MKVVFVNHRYKPFIGGSERWVQEMAEGVVRLGHDASVVTTDAFDLEYFWDRRRMRVSAPEAEDLCRVHVTRVTVRHLPQGTLLFGGTRRLMGEMSRVLRHPLPFRALSKMQPWVPGLDAALRRESGADVVHATNVGLESLAISALDVARALRVPFVLTPFIHLGIDGDPVARRYVSMPHQVELIREADLVLVMTESERDFVAGLRGAEARVVVAGAGVDPAEVTGGDGTHFRATRGISGFLVATVGAMARDKGTFDVAEAVIALRKQGHDVHLALAGPPLQAFTRWYTDLPEADREGIHLLGFVSAAVKRDLLAAMDVMALPSRTESFGIVYLEAWANRKPVIAADTSVTRELIGTGNKGAIVPFGDAEALAEAIHRFASSEEERCRMGEAGFVDVSNCHTWDHVFDRVMRAYEEHLDIDLRRTVSA